ncbi:MAG TPA: YdcF family protein [Hyphomicrobiales bacterium]|nr:YdcF family protein [Hyphomicrobiales bacterium]
MTRPIEKRASSGLGWKAAFFRLARLASSIYLALIGGFLVFAHCVSYAPAPAPLQADAIVALTGDEDRIAEAVRLLAEGRAGRLLISGVNKSTGATEIINLNTTGRKEARLFGCCVDLDRRSLNTEDNAFETTAWVRRRGFRSLIIVTSTYHMPRTLIELRQSMPNVQLLPYPVKPSRLETQWWSDPKTIWVLGKEYLKFLTAMARYAANSLVSRNERTEPSTPTINARLD